MSFFRHSVARRATEVHRVFFSQFYLNLCKPPSNACFTFLNIFWFKTCNNICIKNIFEKTRPELVTTLSNMKYPISVVLFLFFLGNSSLFAQKFGYPTVHERQLIGTKWRYTYTLHVESNTTVHQADKEYQYFLFFRYDFSFEQSLHGKYTKGNWSLSQGNTLFYPFRNIRKFDIAAINNKTLVLEFQQPNATGTYQYHFIAVDSKDAPFVRPEGELPEVIVEADSKNANAAARGGLY